MDKNMHLNIESDINKEHKDEHEKYDILKKQLFQENLIAKALIKL